MDECDGGNVICGRSWWHRSSVVTSLVMTSSLVGGDIVFTPSVLTSSLVTSLVGTSVFVTSLVASLVATSSFMASVVLTSAGVASSEVMTSVVLSTLCQTTLSAEAWARWQFEWKTRCFVLHRLVYQAWTWTDSAPNLWIVPLHRRPLPKPGVVGLSLFSSQCDDECVWRFSIMALITLVYILVNSWDQRT